MGNLIRDLWTYSYSGKQYYGICEVILGDDLQQQRHVRKYETHIEKALQYLMQPGMNVISHMSIQKYTRFLKDKPRRSSDEETYYPFFFEVEPKSDYQYPEAVTEAYKLALFLIYEMDVHEKDLIIMANNSRSIYIFINPKAYNLKPSKHLHEIYKEMYSRITEKIDLRYVDTSLYSHYSLMKTPNTFYKGGYFIPISLQELRDLVHAPGIRKKLTENKRSLDYDIPAAPAHGITYLYQEAREYVYDGAKERRHPDRSQLTFIKRNNCSCVDYIENNVIEKGCRNHALVSVAIYYKNQGFSKEQILYKLIELAKTWGHDESVTDLRSKVAWAMRYDKNFSCEFAREALCNIDMQALCNRCPYNLKSCFRNNTLPVHSEIIEDLWKNKAGTRHYIAYLQLSEKNLFNKWFVPGEASLDDRTLRDLCKRSKNLSRTKEKGMVYISNHAQGNIYYLPRGFLEKESHISLGDYLKHYLKLLIKGYKPFNKYILLRVSHEKLLKDFGYADISGVYKLITKLESIGLIIKKKNNVFCLYYESYKVKELNEHRNATAEKNSEAVKEHIEESFTMAVNQNRRPGRPLKHERIRNRGQPP